MMTRNTKSMAETDIFFIGWASPPLALRGFLIGCAAGLIVVFAVFGYLGAATANDPGDGAFRFDWGRQMVIGRLETQPYPLLHVIESERYETGHTLLLSGPGKTGVQERSAPLDGSVVEIQGIALKRGDLDMLQVSNRRNGLVASEITGPDLPEPVPLGRWRLTGEICDGKCYAGAMRPGQGLSHKACANFCLSGGVPPLFVSTDAVDGATFFLMADLQGKPVTEAVMDHVATLVEVEGAIERRGGMHVLRIDPDTIRLAPGS